MKHTSIIWNPTDLEFKTLVESSPSMSFLLRKLGLENKGNNYQTCKTRIKSLGLDTSHFLNRIQSTKLSKEITKERVIEYLSENSKLKRSSLKLYLIRFHLLDYRCSKCGNDGKWNGEKLSLQLEHLNGVFNDNRLENLTFLCPNCHSQTPTFAGKKLKKHYCCSICGNKYGGHSLDNICYHCSCIIRRKCDRPLKEELNKLVEEIPILQIAKNFDVRDNTIRKWCNEYDIDTKTISKFSRVNRKKPEIKRKIFPSKFLYVAFNSTRNKWLAHIKQSGKSLFCKRFDTEIAAANAVAKFLNLTYPPLRGIDQK